MPTLPPEQHPNLTPELPLDKPISNEKLLELKDVHSFHGNIEALKGVSLYLQEGEIIAILGANGAGKTTTLSSIVGLITPRKGDILFEGKSVVGRPTDKLVGQGLVLVPEGRHIFPALTVLENLKMGAYHRKDKEAIKRDLNYILSLFPILKDRAKQDGGTLSGGEQQMLALGRGLMGKPRLLLLDEPSLGLAPIVIKDIFAAIKLINQEHKTTILLVEQNASLALALAHRAYIMTTGTITLSGLPSDLLKDETVKKAYLGG